LLLDNMVVEDMKTAADMKKAIERRDELMEMKIAALEVFYKMRKLEEGAFAAEPAPRRKSVNAQPPTRHGSIMLPAN